MTECFHRAEVAFDQILAKTNQTKTVLKPEDLFEKGEDFIKQVKGFKVIEFGKQFYLKNSEKLAWDSKPQPSFNKNFDLLVETLAENEKQGLTNLITGENSKQIDRLMGIFAELDPTLQVQTLILGLREGFEDRQNKLICYTDHQLFERFHRYRSRKKASKSKALTLKELKALHPGDYVVHVDYGVGRFAGLEKVEVGGKMQEAVRLVFRDDDLLYVNIHSLHKIFEIFRSGGSSTFHVQARFARVGKQEETSQKAGEGYCQGLNCPVCKKTISAWFCVFERCCDAGGVGE